MKERGSDREKGSAKSCQPEIKQAGTLPIPKPLLPPQSHILPPHSLCFPPLSLSRLHLSLPLHGDIFKPGFCSARRCAYRHTCVTAYTSRRAVCVRRQAGVPGWGSFRPWWRLLFAVSVTASSQAAEYLSPVGQKTLKKKQNRLTNPTTHHVSFL